MNQEALKNLFETLCPGATWDETGQWPQLTLSPAEWPALAQALRNHPSLAFDYLFCLTCVDWKTHLSMVYHLESIEHGHILVVKVPLDAEKPEVETVCNIWQTANFHEREVYEMYGVNFLNHPDLRLLILPDGWEGKNPMRKNYEDPVNMIRL